MKKFLPYLGLLVLLSAPTVLGNLVQLSNIAAASLPAAAAGNTGGVAWDTTNARIRVSDGSFYQQAQQAGYGELFESNDVGTGITVVTAGTFVQWTTSTVGLQSGSPVMVGSTTTDDLTVGANGAGVYSVRVHASFSGNNNIVFRWALFVNGSIRSDCRTAARTSGGSGDIEGVAFSCLVSLASTNTLDLRVTSDTDAETVTVFRVNLNATRVN